MKESILLNLPGDFPWQDRIHYFPTIDSTNTRAKEMAAAGAPHGTVLIADSQTGGRGRLGRQFHSPGGVGIYLSVILRPQCTPDAIMHLTCAAGVAICDAVEAAVGIRPGIKWTNDLVIGKRKLAGILTELSVDAASGSVSYAVVGIGINCCQEKDDFAPDIRDTATSVHMQTGKPVDRSVLAACMIQALHRMDAHFISEKNAWMDAFRRDCITIGQAVSVHRFEDVRHGTALSVDDEGALVVQFPDGHREAVNAGEVSIRGMYGYV